MIDAATNLENETLDPRERRATQRLRVLERTTQIGMALTEAMLARVSDAMNAGEVVDSGAVALEYSRLARAVRQNVALEARLDVEIDVLAAKIAAERAARQAEDERRRDLRMRLHTDCVHTAVRQAIKADGAGAEDKARAKRLNERLREYLDDPREEDDIADLPVSALIARICKTLGVAVDWDLWKDEDWAVAEWREDAPGSPYAFGPEAAAVRASPVSTIGSPERGEEASRLETAGASP